MLFVKQNLVWCLTMELNSKNKMKMRNFISIIKIQNMVTSSKLDELSKIKNPEQFSEVNKRNINNLLKNLRKMFIKEE